MDAEIFVRCEIDELAAVINANGTGRACRNIAYHELYYATNKLNQNAVLGEGKYGDVKMALLGNPPDRGVAVESVINRFTEKSKKEFLAEIAVIGNFRHPNLLELNGWCYVPGEILLVYDAFMPNLTLHKLVHHEDMPFLSLVNRYKIALGIAAGVEHLHTGSERCVIHRDIKPENVILAGGWTPIIGNFWSARSTNHGQSMRTTDPAGSYEYMAPEVRNAGAKASKESDVYSFGIVALELATGSVPDVSTIWTKHVEGNILDVVDERLNPNEFDEHEIDQVRRLLVVGLWCCNVRASGRPQMNDAIEVLGGRTNLSVAKMNVEPQA